MVRKRLGPPYDHCAVPRDSTFYVGMQGQKYPYTKLTCLNACAQNAVVQQCQCFDPALVVDSSREHLERPFCATYANDVIEVVRRMSCAARAKESVNISQCEECLDDCVEPILTTSSTLSVWPKKPQRLWFYRRLLDKKPRSFTYKYNIYNTTWGLLRAGNETAAKEILDKTTLIEENFLKITSYLQSMEATILEDKPQGTITSLMSEIGGILNLYSGVSLIVVIECLDLMYRLLALPWGARDHRKYVNEVPRQEQTAHM